MCIGSGVPLAGHYFLSHDSIQACRYVLAFSVWMVVTGAAFLTDGVRAPAVIAYPVIRPDHGKAKSGIDARTVRSTANG